MGEVLQFPLSAEFGARFPERVLLRLSQAREQEEHPHLIDDLVVAWLTVCFASKGSPMPHVEASYKMFSCHPDVFPRLTSWRKAHLGTEYSRLFDEAGNPRPSGLDIPDYDPTANSPGSTALPISTRQISKGTVAVSCGRTEIYGQAGRVLYHVEQLECGHSHTEFLDANPGKQRCRCLACKDGAALDPRPTIVQQPETESLKEEDIRTEQGRGNDGKGPILSYAFGCGNSCHQERHRRPKESVRGLRRQRHSAVNPRVDIGRREESSYREKIKVGVYISCEKQRLHSSGKGYYSGPGVGHSLPLDPLHVAALMDGVAVFIGIQIDR